MSQTKRVSIAQEFCHCEAGTKTHLAKAAKAGHDAHDICGHFLFTYTTDLIYSISKSMITHEMHRKSIICTRISSFRVLTKTHHCNCCRHNPTMTLSSQTAIFFRLSVQTSSIYIQEYNNTLAKQKEQHLHKNFVISCSHKNSPLQLSLPP